jgi:molecular chaperone DnaK
VRLGIDFGTTHTVVALVDRGNYPVVGFEWGDDFPSAIAARESDGALRFGHEALVAAAEPGWTLLRSVKRLLADSGPLTQVHIGSQAYPLTDLLAGYFGALRDEILQRSNAGARAGDALQAAVSVPANATNDQRFLTLDAFRRAGFDVRAVLNEPSAAGFEYAHRFRDTRTSRREYVLVYDLGGGTFDSSLIHMSGTVNEVVTSTGVPRLGGDDIDAAILDLVLEKAGDLEVEGPARARLLEECRLQKEAVSPNTRRMVVDLEPLGHAPLVLPLDEVSEACAAIVERTIAAMEESMRDPRREEQDAVAWSELAGIYVVGGASSFPLVPRRLKERFGAHRVRRSPHPFAATAIGLATFLDEEKGYALADCLTRHFGVWREAATGSAVIFDPIFNKDTRLPRLGEAPLASVRRYRSAHNVGHFRFVECGAVRDERPDGHVTPWDEIRFPFEPGLRGYADLAAVPVVRQDGSGHEVEERYECASDGIFTVTLAVLGEAFQRTYSIGRPAGTTAPAVPRPRSRGRKDAAAARGK